MKGPHFHDEEILDKQLLKNPLGATIEKRGVHEIKGYGPKDFMDSVVYVLKCRLCGRVRIEKK